MNYSKPAPGIVHIQTDEVLLRDVSSALELMANASYEENARAIIVDKGAVAEDFFILRTRLAGEILQKYKNYQMKLAIVGDFSSYTSKALHDFIYESNKGSDFFFVHTLEEAVDKLQSAL